MKTLWQSHNSRQVRNKPNKTKKKDKSTKSMIRWLQKKKKKVPIDIEDLTHLDATRLRYIEICDWFKAVYFMVMIVDITLQPGTGVSVSPITSWYRSIMCISISTKNPYNFTIRWNPPWLLKKKKWGSLKSPSCMLIVHILTKDPIAWKPRPVYIAQDVLQVLKCQTIKVLGGFFFVTWLFFFCTFIPKIGLIKE